ncbi:MAG: radical SAM protein, partial [Deltaproteobacteria bacterium]|nr:radical SAM protein [Deltaproteobacteria bacterium]
METLGMTQSVCSRCRTIVPAKIVTDGQDVYFHKFCPKDGESRSLIRSDVKDYLRTERYVKPAWKPETFLGDSMAGCPDGCGFCERHEQHLCMPIIEITNRCDLSCPICINASGEGRVWDLSLGEFCHILDKTLESERQVDVINLSGGEPLLHPHLIEMIDTALSRK